MENNNPVLFDDYIVKMVNITKTFGPKVIANKNVCLDIKRGEILSILGENGSGKTTLMNMLAGIYYPDSGEIYVNGEEVLIKSPLDAFNYKIGMVHQHFKLVDLFTASDNIILGEKCPVNIDSVKKDLNLENKKGFSAFLTYIALPFVTFGKKLKWDYLKKNRHLEIQREAERFGFDIDLSRKIYNMSVSEKQTVEIIKVLYKGADLFILDEPTAVLTPQEITKLFNVLRKMKEMGKSIVIITHKLNEVMEISDRVAILRKGEHIKTVNTSQTSEKELTELMVGEKIDLNINRATPQNPRARLVVENLTIKNKEGIDAIKNLNFSINGGEILGIAGISGNGQKELLEGIAGLQNVENGNITFYNPKENKPVTFFHHDIKKIKAMAKEGYFHYPDGSLCDLSKKSNKEITDLVNNEQILFFEDEVINLRDKTPREIRDLGIKLSFVPEDRLGMGLVGNMGIVSNTMLRSYRKGKSLFLDFEKPQAVAEDIIKRFEVVTPNENTPVRKLSGGNVQKVLVGREIVSSPKILMAAYPVRGLDINSSYVIYNMLNEQKEKGVAVMFVGEDLDILLALSDRILVLCGGEVSSIVDARNVTKEELGLLMTKVPETKTYFDYEEASHE